MDYLWLKVTRCCHTKCHCVVSVNHRVHLCSNLAVLAPLSETLVLAFMLSGSPTCQHMPSIQPFTSVLTSLLHTDYPLGYAPNLQVLHVWAKMEEGCTMHTLLYSSMAD